MLVSYPVNCYFTIRENEGLDWCVKVRKGRVETRRLLAVDNLDTGQVCL